MTWIGQENAATALNVVPLPTDIHLSHIHITLGILRKISLIKQLVYRSPVSLSLKELCLRSVAGIRFLTVTQFCKAVCLTSRLEYLSIRFVKTQRDLVLLDHCYSGLIYHL